ncbi:MAG: hypothetical protein ACNA8W_26245, partial [Bradymonadaceae bacterium]
MSLFGDKQSFALAVEPLAGPPQEPDPAAAATWARMQLWVQGKNLFEHTRRDLESFVDGVMWPSIYLARWLVHGWDERFLEAPWPLPTTRRNARDVLELLNQRLMDLVEDEGPEEVEYELIDIRDKFITTHALRAASAGAALPSVYFSRHGDMISIAWRPSRSQDVAFHLDFEEADVPADLFLSTVQEFIRWVREELPTDENVKEDAHLLDAWLNSVVNVDAAERALLYGTGLRDRWP